MNIQIFGTRKCRDTRAALRFFAERRIRVHFADLTVRAASKGELGRFAQKFGVEALVDRQSKRFAELGLGVGSYSESRWLERLEQEPRLLRTPLVRNESQLTIGPAEETWKRWTT